MGVVFGRVARIITRYCQISIAAAEIWDTKVHLDNYCLLELQFWQLNIEKFNKKSCCHPPKYNQIVYSDGSSYACGALIHGGEQFICHKMFTLDEIGCSSTHRELITILYSLQAFGSKLHNSVIKWHTDSQATAKIVEVGSMKKICKRSLMTYFFTVLRITLKNIS